MTTQADPHKHQMAEGACVGREILPDVNLNCGQKSCTEENWVMTLVLLLTGLGDTDGISAIIRADRIQSAIFRFSGCMQPKMVAPTEVSWEMPTSCGLQGSYLGIVAQLFRYACPKPIRRLMRLTRLLRMARLLQLGLSELGRQLRPSSWFEARQQCCGSGSSPSFEANGARIADTGEGRPCDDLSRN